MTGESLSDCPIRGWRAVAGYENRDLSQRHHRRPVDLDRAAFRSPRRTTTQDRLAPVVDHLLSGALGCQWRYLPKDFPPKSTVCAHFDEWRHDGTLDTIHDLRLSRSVPPRSLRSALTASVDLDPSIRPPAAGNVARDNARTWTVASVISSWIAWVCCWRWWLRLPTWTMVRRLAIVRTAGRSADEPRRAHVRGQQVPQLRSV